VNTERFKSVVLFVLGTLKDLEERGMVENNGATAITDSGMARYRTMLADGFETTTEELNATIQLFRQVEAADEYETLVTDLISAAEAALSFLNDGYPPEEISPHEQEVRELLEAAIAAAKPK